ncbi:MAG TPA: OmpH family outer membrane protein [Rhizomicrobium sp.]|nr:OmpH family outer membrane protein [Rhizomicrobium sp.]
MSKTNFAARAAKAASVLAFTAAISFAPAALAQGGQTPPAGGQATPAPKILVIDRAAILRVSKVGQDIVRQVNGYTVAAEKEFKAQSDGLRKEGQALQQQVAILSPDVKAQKIRAFEVKQAAFQQKIEQRQGLIQGGVLKARQQVEAALGPILQGIMSERGANLLLDRNAVVLGTVDVDITRTAVQRLDQKMPSVKVGLVAPPPGLMQAQQQQQQGQ